MHSSDGLGEAMANAYARDAHKEPMAILESRVRDLEARFMAVGDLERAILEILWALETVGVDLSKFSNETLQLWHDYKGKAVHRFAAEQAELRRKALAKLTIEEQQALGLPPT